MIKKRFRHIVPSLNTTSTADISFMLLIFFLVTTSIDNEKGVVRRLPPPPDATEHSVLTVKERNVLRVAIADDGSVTCEDSTITLRQLKKRVETFVDNRNNEPTLPEKHLCEVRLLGKCLVSDAHVISLVVSRNADYDSYFHVQETIVAAYSSLRDRLSRRRFGHPYAECTPEEREALAKCYPQRISETEPEGKGGTQ
ncbi:MAG: ExbD/TolR family protein [Prevotella sp.]